MKKIYLLLIGILIILPLKVLAADYDIKHYYIEAFIKENGDMSVKEAIYLDGSFNGYERDILYMGNESTEYDASNLTNMIIKGKKVNSASFDIFNDTSLTKFSVTDYGYNGDNYKYVLSNLNGGYRYRMYQNASEEMVVFYLEYTLKDVAIKHNDVGEVRWNFIGDDFADSINDLQIKLYIPREDESENFRIFANADNNLIGEVKPLNDAKGMGLYAYTDTLEANSPLTIRVTFDKNILNSSVLKQSNRDALPKILEEEQINADKQNALRKEIRFRYYSTLIISVLYVVAILIIWIYTYLKYDKERKAQFNLKYNREFIDDYNVEVIDYLMHKSITPNALSASLMNLIYKKNISFIDIDGNHKNYQFTLENMDNLNDTEKLLCEFLFTRVGKENKFTTLELKNYASSTRTCDAFMSSYTAWQKKVIEDGEKEEFFEKKKIGIGIIMLIIGIMVYFYNTFLNVFSFITFLPMILGIVFFIYTLCFNRKTEKGIEHYARWQAFRNFLDDFGTFELKELPEIVLWERYLVYATIFGLADKVEKVMNVKIKEIDVNSYGYNPVYIYNNINVGNVINNSVTSAINGAHVAINKKNASSSMSSGSGFGGGFSSGGGFGGGGGGGRGF